MKKIKKLIACLFFVCVAPLKVGCSYTDDRTTINIGVPALYFPFNQYDILKEDLENQFGIRVNLVNLYDGLDFNYNITEKDIIDNIYYMFENNKVDMVMGVPGPQIQPVLESNMLLDITDYIVNIENIHKGVLDISKTMGNGRMFFISPIVSDFFLVFQNQLLFETLNVEPLPLYASWYEFLEKLDELQEAINYKQLDYFPLAMAVINRDDKEVFSASPFFMQALGLGVPMVENGEFTERWQNFFRIWSEIIAKYGKNVRDMDYGRVPWDFLFINGQYALMLDTVFGVEVLFNKDFNARFNENVQLIDMPEFPIKVSFLNYDGSRTQNIRHTVIAINKNTEHKDLAIDILNFILSEEYAFIIIETAPYYSHFDARIHTIPAFYNDATIAKINERYKGAFDASIFYDVEYANVILTAPYVTNMALFEEILNSGFTQVFNNKESENLYIIIEQALTYVESRILEKFY